MNLAANSAMRHVVRFSRTTKMSFSGLGESPERFSTSCSAARRAAASAGTAGLSAGSPGPGAPSLCRSPEHPTPPPSPRARWSKLLYRDGAFLSRQSKWRRGGSWWRWCRIGAVTAPSLCQGSSRQGSVSRLATQVLTKDEKQPREAPPGHPSC